MKTLCEGIENFFIGVTSFILIKILGWRVYELINRINLNLTHNDEFNQSCYIDSVG